MGRLPSAARARYKRTLTSTKIYSAPSHAYRAASHRTVGRTKRGDDAFGKVDFAANPLHSCHNPRSLALPPLSRLYAFTRFADAAILCLATASCKAEIYGRQIAFPTSLLPVFLRRSQQSSAYVQKGFFSDRLASRLPSAAYGERTLQYVHRLFPHSQSRFLVSTVTMTAQSWGAIREVANETRGKQC